VQGEVVSHYRVFERLGGGGMGVVYRAEDVRLKRQVALKFLRHETTEEPAARRRLVREARAASTLDHPNIGTIFEIDEAADGRIFIAMAYYAGETLKQKMRRGPLPVLEALDIAAQIADALACAHQHGIVHRDIKPANVLVTGGERVKLVDFGLALLAGHSRLTRSGGVVGTAYYMSPEQLKGEEVDHRTDLWSLGILLHEMLAAELPFAGDSEAAVILSIVGREPRQLAEARPDVPPRVAAVLRKALAKDPKERYLTASQMAEDLRLARVGFTVAATDTWREPRAAPMAGRARAALASGESYRGAVAPARETPTPRSRQVPIRGILALAALGVAGALLAVGARFWEGRGPSSEEPPRAAALSPGPRTLAVLPFENLTGDPERTYVAEGLAAVLLGKLSELSDLRVAARSEVWPYRQREEQLTVREIARELGVDVVLEGEYQESGGASRVRFSLVDGGTGFVLWSRTVEGRPERLLDLQAALTRQAASLLHPSGGAQLGRLDRAPAGSDRAYDLYLRAQSHLDQLDRVGAPEYAMGLLREAIALDEGFAVARAELARLLIFVFAGSRDPSDLEEAEAQVREALIRDPELPEARLALADLLSRKGDGEAALEELQRLVALYPDMDAPQFRLAQLLAQSGHSERAEATFRRAIQLRPGYWSHWNDLGTFLMARGQLDAAQVAFEEAARRTRLETGWPAQNLAALALKRGDFAAAAKHYDRLPRPIGDPKLASNIGTTWFFLGELEKAEEHYLLAQRLAPAEPVYHANLGDVHQARGELEEARSAYREAARLIEAELRLEPERIGLRVRHGLYGAKAGQCEVSTPALRSLERSTELTTVQLQNVAKGYAVCGEADLALGTLERAVAAGLAPGMISAEEEFRGLAEEPRFRRLSRRN
jgi:eukaryotic-like serine/threonine-protein kinase